MPELDHQEKNPDPYQRGRCHNVPNSGVAKLYVMREKHHNCGSMWSSDDGKIFLMPLPGSRASASHTPPLASLLCKKQLKLGQYRSEIVRGQGVAVMGEDLQAAVGQAGMQPFGGG